MIGLVELYLKTGKPIGSHTLQENGFEDLSSATIRNYFAELETRGFLAQAHASGGRTPTNKALRIYAFEALHDAELDSDIEERLQILKQEETKNLTSYLHKGAELLSEITGYPAFLTSVRFDHDFILNAKLIEIDTERLLCVIITDFGQIFTETLSLEKRLSSFALKRIESYFEWRLKGAIDKEKPPLLPEEEAIARDFYTEIMIRYLVRYSNYSNEELYRTGFSRLLSYSEFNDPITLSAALTLFENSSQMRLLLNDCVKKGDLAFWIGSDLATYSVTSTACSVVTVPYFINKNPVGAFGILGPSRMPYRSLFATLPTFSKYISDTVTKSLYKFKLSYRHPRQETSYLEAKSWVMGGEEKHLLEIKENS